MPRPKEPATWISGGFTHTYWTAQGTNEDYDAYCIRFEAELAQVKEIFPED